MIIKQESSASHEQPPVGSHVARCYQLIDLGTHNKDYNGEKKKAHEVLIGWELCHEHLSEGKFAGQPFHVKKTMTLSMHEKSGLRGMLKSWRGRDFNETELQGFDLRNILNAYCMLSLVESEKGYINVGTVMNMPKGMEKPKAFNEPVYLSLADFDQAIFNNLPAWIKKKIEESEEYKELSKVGKADDLPPVINNGYHSPSYDPEVGFQS